MFENFQMSRSISAYYQQEAANLRKEVGRLNSLIAKMPSYKRTFLDIKQEYIKDAKSYLSLSFQERNAI